MASDLKDFCRTLSDHSLWETSVVTSRSSCSPMGSSTGQGMEGHPANSQHQLTDHGREPPWKRTSRPPAHCHTVRWPQPWLTYWLRPHEGPWDRPVLLSHSWIPDPQKPSKRRNVYCSFKPWSFRATCYSSRELTHIYVKRPCNNTNSSYSSSTRVWL